MKGIIVFFLLLLVGCSNIPKRAWKEVDNKENFLNIEAGDIILKKREPTLLGMFGHTGVMKTDRLVVDYPKLGETIKVIDINYWLEKDRKFISEKLKNEELGKKFLYFLDNIDEFIRIGEKAQNDLMIPREIMEMKSSPTSVRISKEVLEKFNRFCDEHKNYSKMQLMNFALSEFVDRYTKE